ncbi:hypothetical protein FFZ96_17610 [Leptospira borgpetersenii]|nr:hypothetical protein FFZ96_17610 [Leptospira borgpetersenii]
MGSTDTQKALEKLQSMEEEKPKKQKNVRVRLEREWKRAKEKKDMQSAKRFETKRRAKRCM